MAVLVIGGSGRGAGKTAVGCALIAAMPELRWLAVKITPHGHELSEGLLEEIDRNSEKDTGRYLMAGARRAFLIDREDGNRLAVRVLAVIEGTAGCDAVVLESNRLDWRLIARKEESGLALAVIDGDWEKASLLEAAALAHAVVLRLDSDVTKVPQTLAGKRIFALPTGEWMTAELAEFVRSRLLV